MGGTAWITPTLPRIDRHMGDIAGNVRIAAHFLLKDPEKGDIIPRLQGLRKVRMALQGRSRAGGARVIYLYLPQHHTVIFFYIYTKAKSENLTPDQEKRLRAAVETIKREYRHENQGH